MPQSELSCPELIARTCAEQAGRTLSTQGSLDGSNFSGGSRGFRVRANSDWLIRFESLVSPSPAWLGQRHAAAWDGLPSLDLRQCTAVCAAQHYGAELELRI